MENLEYYNNKLIASLKLLSLPYSEQEEYFEDFVDKPFEVIDTFDNAILHLPKLVEIGKFSNQSIASLLRLQNLINFTSSSPKFKDLDYEQFKIADEWNKVREMARDTLRLIREPIEKPDTNYI